MPVQEHTNRLINEKSPYLLQHAHNPVDWFPWGDEAFEKAEAEDKPVFFSCGYSTCHWCHVMERESFEDEATAALLNGNFVSIKVDREEHPDVDHLYMTACMQLNGSGGWPLSGFLTPGRKPFYMGTYFPETDRYGMPGFQTVLKQIAKMWRTQRDELLEASETVLTYVARGEDISGEKEIGNAPEEAFRTLKSEFDSRYGGFGDAPKFPTVSTLLFLLRYAYAGNGEAFPLVEKTLDAMRRGGIYDHIGGGFCRYSTDRKWFVPHFEKMLYDNAQHLMAYAEAGALLDSRFFDTARETAEFCLREMRDPSGGFYTALDADSEGAEGKFYLFTPRDAENALGKPDGERWCRIYDVTETGNFEGKNIPNLLKAPLRDEDREFAREADRRLLAYREKRVRPFRDEKLLVADNGLMVAALAEAGRILKEEKYLKAAAECADFLLRRRDARGRLIARDCAGKDTLPPTCDDYAFLIWGMIELYESTYEPRYLKEALGLQKNLDGAFRDEASGGYFLGSGENGLPLRQKEFTDSAVPSGNSAAALNLLRLSRLTGDAQYEERAVEIASAASGLLGNSPASCCLLLSSVLYQKEGGTEIVLANGTGFETLRESLPPFAPFTVSAACGSGYEAVAELAPFLKAYGGQNGRAAAYVCRKGACSRPVSTPEELAGLLGRTPV